jgi:hypothetical protein
MHRTYANLKGFDSCYFIILGQGEPYNNHESMITFEMSHQLCAIYLVGYGEGDFDYHHLNDFGTGNGFSERYYFQFDEKE